MDVFGEARDGWSGEMDRKRRRRGEPPASTFALRCGECKGTQWRRAAQVTYQGYAADFATAPAERWQDFFDVIAIGGSCVRSGRGAGELRMRVAPAQRPGLTSSRHRGAPPAPPR